MSEYRLRWLGHVQRMDVCNPVKDAWIRDVSGQRPSGRPRLRWRDVVTKDMNERGLCINDAHDKVLWRAGIRSPDPIPEFICYDMKQKLNSYTIMLELGVACGRSLRKAALINYERFIAFNDTDQSEHCRIGPGIKCYQAKFGATKIEGLTGYINLEKGYRDDFDVEIVDLTRKGMIKTGHWTPDDGVVETRPLDHSLKDIYESMRLKTFKVSTILNEPYTMLKKSWQHLKGNDRYEGYCIDLINEIASKMKFRFTIHVVPDHQQGTKDTLTGDWTGMIGELVNGTADLAMGDLTITHERAQAVDFTMPFMNLGIGILFKRPDKTTPSLFSFLSPLALDVWLYMLAAYVGVSVFLFILSRFSPYEWINPHPCNPDSELRENQFSLPNSLWFTGGSLMQQGTELMPKAWSTRMLAGTWWFFTLIMISSYTANLAAFLTSQRMSSPIESAEDLVRQTKIKYGSYAGGSTEMFFRKSKLSTFKRMWAFMESATPSVFTKSGKEGIQRVLDGNYAYLMEVTSIEYITERNCDLTQIGTPLDSKGYGIATPQGSPYQQLISSAILQLQEETRLDSLKLKWWKLERGGGSCKHFDEQQKSLSAAELSLSNVGGVFVVLLGGLAISCVIAMSEFIWETKKINESDRYSLCYEMFEELKQIVNCMGSVKPAKKEPRVKKKKKDSSGRVKVPHKPPERIPTRR
ncbi:Glutamate receptor ionotropic, kainate 2 [Nymphon striatum]|nr:Glutamate receptor ionotropic, kainate 2 [Nymphon striatum]